MNMITLGNLRYTRKGIKCDRSTLLGNPFEMRSEKERDPVCDAFSEYMAKMVTLPNPNPSEIALQIAKKYNLKISAAWNRPYSGEVFMAELEGLRKLAQTTDITLLCWCVPRRCHLETIRAWIS